MTKKMSAMEALEKLQATRKGAPPAASTGMNISDNDRMNLNIFLSKMTAKGWSKEDRAEYLAACKQEFENPTAAGGVEGAKVFWKHHAEC